MMEGGTHFILTSFLTVANTRILEIIKKKTLIFYYVTEFHELIEKHVE